MISEQDLIKIYNFLNNIGHLRPLNVSEAKELAKKVEKYVYNS
jgi:hypothetical protein|tara:strand:- start:8190 stop:8318 length:129 start_codon:yes stop_codon:yes gene_type:complete